MGDPAARRRSPRRIGRFEIALLLIALAGFGFRAGYVLTTAGSTEPCGTELCGDALYYSGQANTLGIGIGWADFRDYHVQAADHPPLTAAFLAPLTKIFGGEPAPVTQQRLAMAVVGLLVIVAVGFLGRRVGGDRGSSIGLIAATIAAINANFWMNDVIVMSESLATLGVVVGILLVYRYLDRPSVGRAAAVGAAIGVAGLARAELLLLLPITFVPLALLTRSLPWPARFGRVLMAGAVAIAVLLPWTINNLSRFDEPVFLSTNDGLTLVGANCDEVYGVDDPGGIGFWQLNCAFAVSDQIPPGADQSVASGVYRRVGLDYIKNHKRLLPKVEAIRLGRAWGVFGPDQMVWLNQGEGRMKWASWTGDATWWLLIVPAVWGAVILRRRREPIWPLVSTAVIVSLTVMVFYGIVRFRLPADVAATVLAAVAIDALVARWRRPKRDARESSASSDSRDDVGMVGSSTGTLASAPIPFREGARS
jgi:4-amino-4-deoxy-L-arabinose transferase-like glycosyltransferase